MEKQCTVCNDYKEEEGGFHRTGYLNDGTIKYRGVCKVCRNGKKRANTLTHKMNQIQTGSITEESQDVEFDTFVSALVELSRYDINRLKTISIKEFERKTNSFEYMQKHNFEEIRESAIKNLQDMGYCHPEVCEYGTGTYLIVGDAHGKHTKRSMFKLLKQVCDEVGIDEVIHVGHLLDDDNDISFCWKDLDNVSILSCIEELETIQNKINSEKNDFIKNKVSAPYNFSITRKKIKLGSLTVMNQNLITDYTKTFVKSLDQQIFNESVVSNLHRHEMFSRTTYNDSQIVGSPGCLCEKHIVKTIKQIDVASGYQVKLAMPKGFKKYRRMEDMYNFWEQGMFIVHVDEDGDFSIVPCRIKIVDGKYTTSYFDMIITEDGVDKPDTKIFINSDMHCDRHDIGILDIQDQIVKDYKPDVYFNMGDMQNNASLNHHEMEKGYPTDKSVIAENSTLHNILRKTSEWADKKYFIYGNHERFSKDFWRKYPQLRELIDSLLFSAIEKYDFNMVKHLDVSQIADTTFVHGDMRLYNQTGMAMEKFARTYKNNVVMGHVHYTAIRFGCYTIGLTGKLDQEYNEPNGSNWIQGCGTCNIYKDVSFISNYSIVNYKTHVNNNKYITKDQDSWVTPEYKFKIEYEFNDNGKRKK